MSRRARAAGFAAAAALCAGLAASATQSGGALPAEQLGELRDVVFAGESLPARRPVDRKLAERALEVRRLPVRFVAADALASPEQAIGRRPAAPIPAGSYLLASQLLSPHAGERPPPAAGRGRRPVEISVAGAGALAANPANRRRRVDVVVTTEPGPGGGPGRTYVAAEAVALLELVATPGPSSDPLPGAPAETWTATLALTREQALRLIQAEAFARSVRLIEG